MCGIFADYYSKLQKSIIYNTERYFSNIRPEPEFTQDVGGSETSILWP
jgi:hypothetical protein